ncbi:uncharacterized protein LOC110906904 [Helianthus annuus]|uniref:uncharacterized protein LOC110906904 n=1 Tax=Helianthus annuus TaxID=4232 RepID=UPI001652F8DA|nr:uncharacterized protein LOC110906904 [Helianthus annuus]
MDTDNTISSKYEVDLQASERQRCAEEREKRKYVLQQKRNNRGCHPASTSDSVERIPFSNTSSASTTNVERSNVYHLPTYATPDISSNMCHSSTKEKDSSRKISSRKLHHAPFGSTKQTSYFVERTPLSDITNCGISKIELPMSEEMLADSVVKKIHGIPKVQRMVRDCFQENEFQDVSLKLIGTRDKDGRVHNLPTASEITALIAGDFDGAFDIQDTVRKKSGGLQRISELHPSYLALQYPLIFPYAEDGYRVDRQNQFSLLLNAKKLFQQFLVDGYTMIESARLNYIRTQQPKLRTQSLKNLNATFESGENNASSCGKPILLPSSFTGGSRYMMQKCLHDKALNAEDRTDIISRLFKCKLDQLIKDFKKDKFFGDIQAVMYTVKFQKCGLPHAHICLFLGAERKFPTASDIDRVISAEIPDKERDPELYELVKQFMIHGPCGSIKYLFKYINKGPDRVTAFVFQANSTKNDTEQNVAVDEIKAYLDCRYISACEAAWRIFMYDLHYRSPAIEVLPFHCEDGQSIVYNDHDNLCDIVTDPTLKMIMFTKWMNCNKVDEFSRTLRYVQFPGYYVWNAKNRKWNRRKHPYGSIGRIHYVPPSLGDCYYLRILLNHIKGPTYFEDIKTVDGQVFQTFKDACFARGLLDDDKEYVNAVKEASTWSTGDFLRTFFVMLLLSNSISRPGVFWSEMKSLLCEDILYQQRKITGIVGNVIILLKLYTTTLKLCNSSVIGKKLILFSTFVLNLDLQQEELENICLSEIEKLLLTNGSTVRNFDDMPSVPDNCVSSSNNRLTMKELSYDRLALQREHDGFVKCLTAELEKIYKIVMEAIEKGDGDVFLYMVMVELERRFFGRHSQLHYDQKVKLY